MKIGKIQGATRVLGETQGYQALFVRDEVTKDTTNGEPVNTMLTAWLPDAAELQRLNAGAPIILSLFGTNHPPVMLHVGQPETKGNG